MAAMVRTEAGELFAQAGQPEERVVSEHPWRIRFHQRGPEQSAPIQETQPPAGEPEQLPDVEPPLSFRYPYQAAVDAPSKVTATQLKGRELDREAAEQAVQPLSAGARRWRRPAFLTQRPLDGREIGTATHLAMQFLRYEACGSREGVEAELARLLAEGFLNARQAQAVNRRWIGGFFQTELGQRLREGQGVLREFKFSILEDGQILEERLAGEEPLLQGVVDCCLMEDDGITILDFKTDRIRPGEEAAAAARYAGQVRTYGQALSRIFEKPVKRCYCISFRPVGCKKFLK